MEVVVAVEGRRAGDYKIHSPIKKASRKEHVSPAIYRLESAEKTSHSRMQGTTHAS